MGAADIEPVALPEDRETLQALVCTLRAERDRATHHADQLQLETLRLQGELERYKKWYYGPRADRLPPGASVDQLLLAFAEEWDRRPIHPDDGAPATEPTEPLRRVRKRPGRRQLATFDNLPVTTRTYELSEPERACPCCGRARQEVGADESWQIEYYPGHFERLQHIRKKYACGACERDGQTPQMATAAKPDAPIDKGLAGPALLAYIVTSKFSDYLPLYRLEDIFERQGFEIARATQSVWCGDVADLTEPLYAWMAERVRASHVVATDDTILPMQSPGQAVKARMWVYVGDEAGPYNLFDFTRHRGRDGPRQFLRDYGQVLLADAYGGYNGVVAGNQITRAGCWAHLRRKFIDAEKAAPGLAQEAIALVRALYDVERLAKDETASARLALRQERAGRVLTRLQEKLLAWQRQLLPKHPMAEAVHYALSQWDELNVFSQDGAVPIDNNVSEREMKRIVLNRKNSLFVGNARGGRTAAILASLTSTCRRHGIDPQRYLTQLLVNLPTVRTSQLGEWAPDQWKLRQTLPPASPNLSFT